MQNSDADLETFGRSHGQAEKIIEESGIPYTFLRPNGFMQNFLIYYGQSIKTQGAFYIPAGDGKLGLVDVRDIAAVREVLLAKGNGSKQQHENKSYDLTGPEALSYSQAAEILSKETGKKISFIDIPEEDARKGMKQVGIENWFIDASMEAYSMIKAGHASKLTTVVEQITGRKPISFTQFAKDYAEFFR